MVVGGRKSRWTNGLRRAAAAPRRPPLPSRFADAAMFTFLPGRSHLDKAVAVLSRGGKSRILYRPAGADAIGRRTPFPHSDTFRRPMDEFLAEELWTALEERQNELILRLDELNERIEAALAELERPADRPMPEAA